MARIEKGIELARKYKTLLDKNGINTPKRLAHFFGQAYAESKLEVVREDLRYSALTLSKVFKKYFPTIALANRYAYKPAAIANKAYANRMGNGNEASGDGYKYRGCWYFQITGFNNFAMLSKDTGIDFTSNPDSKMTEADAIVSAIWFWNKNNLNKHADRNDIDAVSDSINIGKLTSTVGDANGYAHRVSYTNYYLNAFN